MTTGAGRGIGEAVARRLAGEGARVLTTDIGAGRGEGAAARARAAVRPAGTDGAVGSVFGTGTGTAEAFVCDVGDHVAVDAAVAHAVARFGSLDVLVNNAGTVRTPTHVRLAARLPTSPPALGNELTFTSLH